MSPITGQCNTTSQSEMGWSGMDLQVHRWSDTI